MPTLLANLANLQFVLFSRKADFQIHSQNLAQTILMKCFLQGAIFTLFLLAFMPAFANDFPNYQRPINPKDVTIIRDKWGTPHIYGQTDADAAYGLAYSLCESQFEGLQLTLIAGLGHMGLVEGKDGAKADFFQHAIGTDSIVNARYDKAFSEGFKHYLKAYAQGINDYAANHPDNIVLERIYPVGPKDIVKAHFISLAFVTGAQDPIQDILEGSYEEKDKNGVGSNAFAFNTHRTVDSSTYLCIDPHLPLKGDLTVTEAHMVSDEGMNMMGALPPGGVSVLMGTNQNLGWAHTWNGLDLVDVYKLEMHPDKDLHYKFDGEWLRLDERPVKLKVNLWWFINIPVKRTTYWSKYGPTFQSDDGEFYALRYGANQTINYAEQWYRMGKAKNLEEFKDAMSMRAVPRFNTVYADDKDNTFLIGYGSIPDRDTSYDWTGVVPGDTFATLWQELHTLDQMPQKKNPDCGYLYNMNNTPYNLTCDEEAMYCPPHHETMGYRLKNNNRSRRFEELMNNCGEYVSFSDMKRFKYDRSYPQQSVFLESVEPLLQVDTSDYPEVSTLLHAMQNWDRRATLESVPATYFLLTFNYIFDKKGYDDHAFFTGIDVSQELFIDAVTYAKEFLQKHYNTTNVPLKKVQRLIRGDKNKPMPGFPDALAAAYSKPHKNGQYKTFISSGYTMFVEYTNDGASRIETVLPFGTSNDPDSPHFSDQMDLFVNQQTKTMSLDLDSVLHNAERLYHPYTNQKVTKKQFQTLKNQ